MFTASDLTWGPMLAGRSLTIIDPECATEGARLMQQYLLLTACPGYELLPASLAGRKELHILDLACGSGGWAIDVAFACPESEIIGVTGSRTQIVYAQCLARAQGSDHLRFQVMDLSVPLDLPDGAFDLIHLCFVGSCLLPEAWPALLRECRRLLRPGGLLAWRECHAGYSSSPACEALSQYYARALSAYGLPTPAVGLEVGPVHPTERERLLTALGYGCLETQRFHLDFSAGTPAHYSLVENIKIFVQLLRPSLLTSGVLSAQDFERLSHAMWCEMREPSFVGSWSLTLVLAQAQPGLACTSEARAESAETKAQEVTR